MSFQQRDNIRMMSPPRTPVLIERIPLSSPPQMLQNRGGEDSVKDEGYLNDKKEQQISNDREHIRASEFPTFLMMGMPSFPMMGTTVPQEQSMEVNTNHSEVRNSYRRRPRRRSSSFDALMPIPRISLRPRYHRNMGRNVQESQLPRQLPPSVDLFTTHQEDCRNTSPISRKRQHLRSYTFDGNDTTGYFNDSTQVSSPPVNAPSFAMSYLHQALPTSQFSPLGNDSPHASVARPIARHLTPGPPKPMSSSAKTNGVAGTICSTNGVAGTICSSSTSAFETASSTFAQSRQGDSATAGSFENLYDSHMDHWHSNASTSYKSYDTKESEKEYPSEVCLTGDSVITSKKYRESSTYNPYDPLDSPNSSGSDDIKAQLHSATGIATGKLTPNEACDDNV